MLVRPHHRGLRPGATPTGECSRCDALDERADQVDRTLPVGLVEELVTAARVLLRAEVCAAAASDRLPNEHDRHQRIVVTVDPEQGQVAEAGPAVDGVLRTPE